jgi:threonine dehydrogenase-like Zn-dependent dehydrogenase
MFGELPTTVFDATGSAVSMVQAVQYVEHGGTLAYVSLVQGDIAFRDTELHRRELTLLRSRNALAADFRWALSMVEDGRIALDPWITHRVPVDRVAAEFSGWLHPDRGVVKAVVEF